MISITLKGEPLSTGSIYKSICRGKFASVYMSNKGKMTKESYQWQAKAQYKGQPLEGLLKVEMELYVGTKRKCDIDNFNKLCFDSLTGTVWVDDSQIRELTIKKGYDKENPRITLQIEQVELSTFDS